jgi:hypothetical protein
MGGTVPPFPNTPSLRSDQLGWYRDRSASLKPEDHLESAVPYKKKYPAIDHMLKSSVELGNIGFGVLLARQTDFNSGGIIG